MWYCPTGKELYAFGLGKRTDICMYQLPGRDVKNGARYGINTQWNVIQPYKRKNAICSNMDGPRDYHTKWSKSDRERQIPYYITYR